MGFMRDMELLSDGFRSYFNQTGKMTIQRMIQLLSSNSIIDKVTPYGIIPVTNRIVNVKNLGATGNGITDDTVAIQTALNQVKVAGGGIVYVPEGNYMIKTTNAQTHDELQGIGLDLPHSSMGLQIGDNTTLLLDEGAMLNALPSAAWYYLILNVQGVKNVNVLGGTFNGDRLKHDKSIVRERDGRPWYGEWGTGINTDSSSNVNIIGTTFNNFWGDGISVYPEVRDKDKGAESQTRNLLIKDCVFDFNRRQGISLGHTDTVTIMGNLFQNTNGTGPASGLDLEPGDNSTESVSNVTIKENTFLNNNNQGLTMFAATGTKVQGVKVLNNTFKDNGGRLPGQVTLNQVQDVEIAKNKIINSDGTREFGIISMSSSKVNIHDNYAKNSKIQITEDTPGTGFPMPSGSVVNNYASTIEVGKKYSSSFTVSGNQIASEISQEMLKSYGDPNNHTAKITHPYTATNVKMTFHDFIGWGDKKNVTSDPTQTVWAHDCLVYFKGDLEFDIDGQYLHDVSDSDFNIHFDQPIFTLDRSVDDSTNIQDWNLIMGDKGLKLMNGNQQVGTVFADKIQSNGTFTGTGIQHFVIKDIEFGDNRQTGSAVADQECITTIITADGKKYAYTFQGQTTPKPDQPVSDGIMIVPKGKFGLSAGLKNSNGTILLGKDDWATINGLAIDETKALSLTSKAKLHLYVTDVAPSSLVWLKWDDTNERTEFNPVKGENVISLPSIKGESSFKLILHSFNLMTIDPAKSYIEAVPAA